MCAGRRTKWILGNVQNNYRNMTDYVNRQLPRRRTSNSEGPTGDGQKFDDDVARWHRKKVMAGWAKTLSVIGFCEGNDKEETRIHNRDSSSPSVYLEQPPHCGFDSHPVHCKQPWASWFDCGVCIVTEFLQGQNQQLFDCQFSLDFDPLVHVGAVVWW